MYSNILQIPNVMYPAEPAGYAGQCRKFWSPQSPEDRSRSKGWTPRPDLCTGISKPRNPASTATQRPLRFGSVYDRNGSIPPVCLSGKQPLWQRVRPVENQGQLYFLQPPLWPVLRAAPNVGFMKDIVSKPVRTDRATARCRAHDDLGSSHF